MKTMRMRLASWLMIVCILTGVFASSVSVQAADTTWEELVDMCQFGLTTTKYLLTSTFGFFTQDLDTYMKNNDKYWQYAKDFQARWDGKEEGQTEIEVTKEELQGLYDIAKADVTALNGYYLVSANNTNDEIYNYFKNSIPEDNSVAFYDFMKSAGSFVVYKEPGSSFTYYRILPFSPNGYDYLYLSNGTFYEYGTDKKIVASGVRFVHGSWYKNYETITDYAFPYANPNVVFWGYSGAPFKLFYSSVDVYKYINGDVPSSLQSSNFQMPVLSGNTLNVDLSKAAETDWSKVNKSIYDAVSDAITDAGGWAALDETQKQEIIDSKMDDILGSLGEIGDNTGESNALLSSIKDILKAMQKTLEDIYMDSGDTAWKNAIFGHLKDIVAALTNISSSSKISAEHLFDIKGKVQVLHDKFSDFSFQTLIDTIKDVSGGGGGSGTVVGSTIGTVIGSLISDLIDKIQNGEETVEDAVADLTGKFSNLADTSKTKFPFSLPWDVILIFSSLAAEPETPVFDYPFEIKSIGFQYDIHMDFKDFEKMSQLTRSFFAITFAFLLVKLTLLMINRGDFD